MMSRSHMYLVAEITLYIVHLKYVSYENLSLDMANELNNALETLPEGIGPAFVGDSTSLEAYRGSELPDYIAKYIEEATEKTVAKGAGSGMMKPKKKGLSKYLGEKIVKTDNQSIREWYYANVSDIPNQIDKTKSFDEQVKLAFELRNKYKHEARVAMSDVKKAQELEELRPVLSFEELVESKMKRKNMNREEALQDILKTTSKTNPDVNKEFGL